MKEKKVRAVQSALQQIGQANAKGLRRGDRFHFTSTARLRLILWGA